jgi:hypothetical protein
MKALLRLIYDLQEGPSEADILLYPRSDVKIREVDPFGYLKGKFGVIHGRSRRGQTGWPFGPNAVAMDVFRLTHENWKNGLFDYKAAMLVEADCVPLRRTWLRELSEEWSGQSKLVLGHWDGSGKVIQPPISHVNGNLLFHPKIVDEIPDMAYGDVPVWGWDMAFWKQIAPFATPSRLIFNDYRLNTKNKPLTTPERLFQPRFHTHPENPLYGQELHPCYIHGCKGMTAIKYVREQLLA